MKLDDQTAVLVALGSAAVNCHDCLRRLGDQAIALALSPQEMTAAEVELRVSGCCSASAERGC